LKSEESLWVRGRRKLAMPALLLARRDPSDFAPESPIECAGLGALAAFRLYLQRDEALAFPVIASEARQSRPLHPSGLPRRRLIMSRLPESDHSMLRINIPQHFPETACRSVRS
jgi:hypothetical protein